MTEPLTPEAAMRNLYDAQHAYEAAQERTESPAPSRFENVAIVVLGGIVMAALLMAWLT